MLIEDHGMTLITNVPSESDVEEPTYPLTDNEIFSGKIDPANGLFVGSVGDVVASVNSRNSRLMGANAAGLSLRRGLVDSGLVRRWYTFAPHEEVEALDRQPGLVTREHLVPMPLAWRVPIDEGVVLLRSGMIHAFLFTGLEASPNLLLRSMLQVRVPHMSFAHSLQDMPSEFLRWFSGQTFPFDVIVSPSECGKRVLQNQFARLREALGISPFDGDIVVIPHGTNTAHRWPSRAAARKALGHRDDELVFVSIGRFDRGYKADCAPLLVAFSRHLQAFPASRLVLGGGSVGHYHYTLHHLAEELGIADRVEIRANMQDSTKDALLAGGDIMLAIADNVQETHGLSVVEAMAAGLPVIAASWNGFAETVVHEQTGLLVPTCFRPTDVDTLSLGVGWLGSSMPSPQQPDFVHVDLDALEAAMARLAEAPALRANMGRAGQARAQAELDSTKNGKRAAERLCESVRDAQTAKLAWRPHLGADWTQGFASYASLAPARGGTVQARRREPVGDRWFSQVDRSLRARAKQVLARLQALDGAALEDAVMTLEREFPTMTKRGIVSLVWRAAKQGVVSLT